MEERTTRKTSRFFVVGVIPRKCTTMIFKPHSEKQRLALRSEKPIVVLACGIQFGKTITGAFKMKMAMHKYTGDTDNFIVTAPTYKIMQQSTLPAFLAVMENVGDFNKVDMCFRMRGGGTCYFRTATDPNSVVGVTNVRFIWADEAGLYPLLFWENIQARAAFKQAQIILTTSPYTLNWLYTEIIRPIMKGGPNARADVELVRARSDENPYFPKAYYDEKKKTMDPRRFQAMFGGEWNKFQGLVYDCFEYDTNTCDPFPLPSGSRLYAGVDWGYTNPSAITVRAITPDGYHFQVGEIYESHLTIADLVERAKDLKQLWGIERFYCDPSGPGNIEEFCRNGLPAVKADNDIRKGIDAHYELVKTGRFKMFRGRNRYSIDEIEQYFYPQNEDERGPEMDYRERLPVKRHDHLMDTMRYLSIALNRHTSLQPVVAEPQIGKKKQEGYEERYKRLTSLKNTATEEWS
jgi:PBSX family phage terminase large subunit